MDKKTFNKITKEVFQEYGFVKEKSKFILVWEEITFIVTYRSWRGVKSFDFYFTINKLHDSSLPYEERADCIVEYHMQHDKNLDGYHKHEIVFEKYDEETYRAMLTKMLHEYFDPYKEHPFEYIKNNAWQMCLSKKLEEFLN